MSATAGGADGVIPRLTLKIENEDSTEGSRERQGRERRVLVTFKPWRKPGLPHEFCILWCRSQDTPRFLLGDPLTQLCIWAAGTEAGGDR